MAATQSEISIYSKLELTSLRLALAHFTYSVPADIGNPLILQNCVILL